MATVQDVLTRKGSEVIALPPTETVLAAANLMNQRGIGGLVVVEQQQVIGVFTERDVLRRVVAERRHPDATTIREVMSAPVITCRLHTTLEECAALMTAKRIRHLPVVGDSGLCGVITIGDVLAFQVSEQQATIQYMNSFIYDVR